VEPVLVLSRSADGAAVQVDAARALAGFALHAWAGDAAALPFVARLDALPAGRTTLALPPALAAAPAVHLRARALRPRARDGEALAGSLQLGAPAAGGTPVALTLVLDAPADAPLHAAVAAFDAAGALVGLGVLVAHPVGAGPQALAFSGPLALLGSPARVRWSVRLDEPVEATLAPGAVAGPGAPPTPGAPPPPPPPAPAAPGEGPPPPPPSGDRWARFEAGDPLAAALFPPESVTDADRTRVRDWMREADPARRALACRGTIVLGWRSSVQNLRALLRDPAPEVRAAAAEAIGHLAGPAMEPAIRPLLTDAAPAVRDAAAAALRRLGASR